MKKTLTIVSSLLITMMAASVVSANQLLTVANNIKPDLQTTMINQGGSDGGPQYTVIDHNPTSYNKQVLGGHTVEGWTENGVVYTAVDGVI